MPLFAICFPKLSQSAHDWIESFRFKHDERFGKLIGAHFTLVFSVEGTETEIFAREVKKKAATFLPISLNLQRVGIVKDALSEYWQVHLIPTAGREEITSLHDALYSGILRPHLSNIPFVPHITIAESKVKSECADWASVVSRAILNTNGIIEAIDVVSFEDDIIRRLSRIMLG